MGVVLTQSVEGQSWSLSELPARFTDLELVVHESEENDEAVAQTVEGVLAYVQSQGLSAALRVVRDSDPASAQKAGVHSVAISSQRFSDGFSHTAFLNFRPHDVSGPGARYNPGWTIAAHADSVVVINGKVGHYDDRAKVQHGYSKRNTAEVNRLIGGEAKKRLTAVFDPEWFLARRTDDQVRVYPDARGQKMEIVGLPFIITPSDQEIAGFNALMREALHSDEPLKIAAPMCPPDTGYFDGKKCHLDALVNKDADFYINWTVENTLHILGPLLERLQEKGLANIKIVFASGDFEGYEDSLRGLTLPEFIERLNMEHRVVAQRVSELIERNYGIKLEAHTTPGGVDARGRPQVDRIDLVGPKDCGVEVSIVGYTQLVKGGYDGWKELAAQAQDRLIQLSTDPQFMNKLMELFEARRYMLEYFWLPQQQEAKGEGACALSPEDQNRELLRLFLEDVAGYVLLHQVSMGLGELVLLLTGDSATMEGYARDVTGSHVLRGHHNY